jgi:hypothetical protein
MPIIISGSTGISGVDGTVSSPAIQGADTNTGVFYPAADQVAIATGGVQRLLVDASGIVTTGVGALYPLVSGTAVASTSGTSIDFTGIPSWVKRITIMLSGVSTNGTSNIQVQVGSGSFSTTSYLSSVAVINAGTSQAGSTTGIIVTNGLAAANNFSGLITFALIASNQWVASGNIQHSTATGAMFMAAGYTPALAGVLDRVRITTVGGTDTFDAGSINILYE